MILNFFTLRIHVPPISTLFPYTTLFRSGQNPPRWRGFRRLDPCCGHQMMRQRNCVVHPVCVGEQRNIVAERRPEWQDVADRKSTRLNSSHTVISYAVFCLKKKTQSNATQ